MIQVQDLSFTYPGAEKPTLNGLNFDIDRGEIFGFLGPSGAGKSTTQKVLYKILHGFQGQVNIDGKSIMDWDKTYFEKIGVGFELPNHYLKLTAKENMELFSTFYKKEKLLNLSELFDLVGLGAHMDQKVEAYSKGMKMRLNFIRAIMHQPEILFFDEPTAGLDPVNAKVIRDHIMELKNKGKTIFITTHNMNTADELCDRVSFIVDGVLQLTEKPSQLKHQYGQNLVRAELKGSVIKEFPLADLSGNQSFHDFLKQGEIERINTLEASLDDVFIKVTGQTLKV